MVCRLVACTHQERSHGCDCDGPVESDEGSSLALQEFSLWPFGAGCSVIRPLSGVRNVDVAHTCGAGREAQTCLDRNVDIGDTCGAGSGVQTCLDRNIDVGDSCGPGREAQTCLDRNVDTSLYGRRLQGSQHAETAKWEAQE